MPLRRVRRLRRCARILICVDCCDRPYEWRQIWSTGLLRGNSGTIAGQSQAGLGLDWGRDLAWETAVCLTERMGCPQANNPIAN